MQHFRSRRWGLCRSAHARTIATPSNKMRTIATPYLALSYMSEILLVHISVGGIIFSANQPILGTFQFVEPFKTYTQITPIRVKKDELFQQGPSLPNCPPFLKKSDSDFLKGQKYQIQTPINLLQGPNLNNLGPCLNWLIKTIISQRNRESTSIKCQTSGESSCREQSLLLKYEQNGFD